MRFKYLFLLALLLLVPGLSFAEAGEVTHKTASGWVSGWDIYAFGNGQIVVDILKGIRLLMVPDYGSSGFRSLLLFLATVGFVVLAIGAGFDPGKNLMRMFGHLLLVFFVLYASTSLTADVIVVDPLSERRGIAAGTVENVPALVALPAAITSEVGNYFTRSIETNFSVPSTFAMAQENSGQFNLFGRMMEESSQYVFSSPELRRSIAAYSADCVVPAIATGRLVGPTPDGPQQGVQALTNTSDMLATLKSATHKSIMTKYFPMASSGDEWRTLAGSPDLSEIPVPTGGTLRGALMGFGAVVTCEGAIAAIEADITRSASELLGKGNDAWSKTGTATTYETAMTMMLQQVAGGAPGINTPAGYIRQQALLNVSNGSFRQAAMQTGNNELMQAAAIAQAEASQKSAWVTGFALFNNMMGYVYVVLQCFIFAVTPMVVVALMIPGMGKAIFTNYAQILVWLTLWQPMLAIVNYIITLFGINAVSGIVATGGLTMSNKAVITEKTNDLMVAAQFLGTMVPLITWGLVKGAMAFTEFISSGVGSSFAASAGASAATGNLSMNNMSMDNTSTSKFNTAMSSTVGTQEVSAFGNAGAGLMTQQAGGSGATANGSAVNVQEQFSKQTQSMIAEQKAVSSALSAMQGKNYSESQLESMSRDKSLSTAERTAAQQVLSRMQSAGSGDGAGTSTGTGSRANVADNATGQIDRRNQHGANFSADARLQTPGKSISPVGGAVGVGYEASMDGSTGNTFAKQGGTSKEAGTTTNTEKDKLSSSTQFQSGKTVTDGKEIARTSGETTRGSRDTNTSFNAAVQDALSKSESITRSLQKMEAVTSSFGIASNTTLGDVQQGLEQLRKLRDSHAAADELDKKAEALTSQLTGRVDETNGRWNELRDKQEQVINGIKPLAQAPSGTQAHRNEVRGGIAKVQGEIDRRVVANEAQAGNIRVEAEDRKATYGPQSTNLLTQPVVNPRTGEASATPAKVVDAARRFVAD